MLLKEIPQVKRIEMINLFNKELFDIVNVEILILKGHILMEYCLNKYINSLSQGHKDIEEQKFTFSEKIKIADLFGMFDFRGQRLVGNNKELYDCIKTLNRARNQIAHTLTFDKNILKDIYKYFGDSEEIISDHKVDREVQRLKPIITTLCGYIMGRLEIKIAINNELLKYPQQNLVDGLREEWKRINNDTPDN